MKNLIYFVYSDGCSHCKKVKACIYNYLERTSCVSDLIELDSESEDALDLAISCGAEEVPFVLVNDNLLLYQDFDFNQDAIAEYLF